MSLPLFMSPTRHPAEILQLLSTVIIADDLTGACDSAAAFAAKGQEARVVLHPKCAKATPGKVASCTLEARNLPPDEAAEHMRAAADNLLQAAPDVLFCKIDSAGRGPIANAILGLLEASNSAWALVAPSFPDQGRVVRDGVLRLRPSDCDAARQVPLDGLFPESTRSRLGFVPAGNEQNCRESIAAALKAGRRILLCDAGTQGDLSALVLAARSVEWGRVLWCGSAGLARALAESYSSGTEIASGIVQGPSYMKSGDACLLLVGTPHPVTAGQLIELNQLEGVARIECVTASGNVSAAAKYMVATVRCGETSEAQVRTFWEMRMRSSGVNGLILTGGDTAALVLRALGAESILVRGEIESGIPWGVIEGGMAAGYRVITKSGGFGCSTALLGAVRFLEKTA